MRLIGVLEGYAESDSAAQSNIAAFWHTLAKLGEDWGWTEGSNLRIELRWSAGNADRTRTFAKELVDLRADAILCDTTPGIAALATIPIVFTAVADPVASGFVESLAHPGGNLTGFTTQAPAIGGKWVGLLKEIAPRTVRVAMLFNPATAPTPQLYMPPIAATSQSWLAGHIGRRSGAPSPAAKRLMVL